MLFSCGVSNEARRDYYRIRQQAGLEEARLIRDCWRLLCGMVRYDPHLLGRAAQGSPLRAVACGLLQVVFVVRPLEDRYVEIRGVGRNPNWEW